MRIWRTNLWLLFFLILVQGANSWWPFGNSETDEQPKAEPAVEKFEVEPEEGSGIRFEILLLSIFAVFRRRAADRDNRRRIVDGDIGR
jgi:hypothetical protein